MLPNEIVDFYLTKAPYAHSDKPTSRQSLDLAEHGWSGKKALDDLVRYIIANHMPDSNPNVRFVAASDVLQLMPTVLGISDDASLWETDISSMNIGGVFCIKNKLTMDCGNRCTCKLEEAYVTCFFRHIRNSIAHGNYQQHGTRVLFLDQLSSMSAAKPKYSAVFLTTINFLVELSRLVFDGYSTFALDTSRAEKLLHFKYRIPRKLFTLVDDNGLEEDLS